MGLLDYFRKRSPERSRAEAGEAVEYEGFSIVAAPQPNGSQFNVAGVISRSVDGVVKEHRFVRADSYASRDDAVTFSVAKARVIIDQFGDRMFDE